MSILMRLMFLYIPHPISENVSWILLISMLLHIPGATYMYPLCTHINRCRFKLSVNRYFCVQTDTFVCSLLFKSWKFVFWHFLSLFVIFFWRKQWINRNWKRVHMYASMWNSVLQIDFFTFCSVTNETTHKILEHSSSIMNEERWPFVAHFELHYVGIKYNQLIMSKCPR